MMTGEEYKKSLDDGRTVYFEGQRIDDLPGHPLLGVSVARAADEYDQLYDPEPGALSPLMSIPRSEEDLWARIPLLKSAGHLAHVTYTSLMTLLTIVGKLDSHNDYSERISSFVHDMQQRDLRVMQCVTDAKGDRSRRPAQQRDADAYVHVVDRSSDGVVVRGAKLHITCGSLGHELMVIPTKAMRSGEDEYAIACAIPVNSPGVTLIETTYAPRHADPRSFPYSSKKSYPDSFIVFEDVFVPNERIFLDGDFADAAAFAHALGLWERLGGLSAMADEADAMVGLAQLVAEANGTAGIHHIKEKIAEMIIQATLLRAALESAIGNCKSGALGAVFPDELYTNAGKHYGIANFHLLIRNVHDIAGAAIVTAPSVADLENATVGPLVRKYMATSDDVDGEYRTRLFHGLRDLTADSYGGWKQVAHVQGGGGLYAQRVVSRKHYDMDNAKLAALELIGLAPPGVASAGSVG